MIRVIEVGPRDGLQNEPTTIPTAVKVDFVNALSKSGVDEIEVSSFVSPSRVPQLGDAEQVFASIDRAPGITYSCLVPNLRGLERAEQARVDKIGVFTAASETFNKRNINATIDESFARFEPVLERAANLGLAARGYVSTAFYCPYEGKIEATAAARVVARLLDAGVGEVSIGDTIGRATPDDVRAVLDACVEHHAVEPEALILHFHDTFGNAAKNVLEGWRWGVRAFDASTGGIGGCPFAPGAPGNLATETLVAVLREAGARVEVDLDALEEARKIVAPYLAKAGADPVRIY